MNVVRILCVMMQGHSIIHSLWLVGKLMQHVVVGNNHGMSMWWSSILCKQLDRSVNEYNTFARGNLACWVYISNNWSNYKRLMRLWSIPVPSTYADWFVLYLHIIVWLSEYSFNKLDCLLTALTAIVCNYIIGLNYKVHGWHKKCSYVNCNLLNQSQWTMQQ